MDLGKGIRKALARITGAVLIDEKAVKEMIKDIQRALITSDVNVQLVFELSKRIEERALKTKMLKGTTLKEHIVNVVYNELVSLMGEKYEPNLKPHKILLCGLYGSGKTTSAAKLSLFYKERGLSTGLICADITRPAAYEQLQQLASKVGIAFYGEKGSLSVERIIENGLKELKLDIIIIDSSGRDGFDAELMSELKKINEIAKPEERLLVVNADIGQVAKKQAEEFNKVVDLTGVIVTKMDGSGKGGGALSAITSSHTKIAFIGTGEKIEDLEAFDAQRFVSGLLGFPDIGSLIEKIKKISEEESIKPEELMEEKFTVKTFYEQLRAAKKLGPFKNIFKLLGGVDIPSNIIEQGEEKLKKFEVIINSMTKEEREDIGLVKRSRSRMERIARGSGTSFGDVRDMIGNFEKMEKLFNAFKKNRGVRSQIERIMKSGIKFT